MTVNRTTSLITGTVATIAGLVVSFFVVKGTGDVLFPEVPGFSLKHAFLFVLAALLLASFLFAEAYRLFKAAANCKRKH